MRPPPCPMCPGHGCYMGTLGYLKWFRCRNCGWEFYREKRKTKKPSRPTIPTTSNKEH